MKIFNMNPLKSLKGFNVNSPECNSGLSLVISPQTPEGFNVFHLNYTLFDRSIPLTQT